MLTINNILALSTLSLLKPLNVTISKKKWNSCFLLISIITFSFLHHLTETNEVGHNLDGNEKLFFLNKYSFLFRYLDIFFSYILFGYMVYDSGISIVFSFIISNKIIFILFFINFICDFIISNQPWLYLFLHFIWHSGISFILLKYYQNK